MRWKTAKSPKKSKTRPFLVLPLIEVDNSSTQDQTMRKKPDHLRLFTRTFTPKEKTINDENARPLTATLEKPQVLDIRYIDKIDMSLVRKEFLCITNLCRALPVAVSKARRKPPPNSQRRHGVTRPLILPSKGIQKISRPGTSDDSWEDESSCSQTPTARAKKYDLNRRHKMIKQPAPVTSSAPVRKPSKKISHNDTNNNFNTYRVTKKRMVVPLPCNTCGRPDQPERFHSHPETPGNHSPKKKMDVKAPIKNVVQKPVAIKYKSKLIEKNNKNKVLVTPGKTNSGNVRLGKINSGNIHLGNVNSGNVNLRNVNLRNINSGNINSGNINSGKIISGKPTSASTPIIDENKDKKETGKGPKTLMCYICGREFGTMSLPIHEPKCLEKWERENANLPRDLRRKKPVKPDKPLTREEYNTYAWESAQANLVPCKNCNRTFYPDRLMVHLKTCKPSQSSLTRKLAKFEELRVQQKSATTRMASPPGSNPKGIPCSVCGRLFGTQSIKFHEPQCLRKWHLQNDHLPPNKREPMYSETVQIETEKVASTPQTPNKNNDEPNNKKPPMFPCYLCGRLFSVNSIYIHEPQCLKKWKIENDKLPPFKRKPVPVKPDIKFTPSGGVDFVGTFHRIWDNHLAELVECRKCGRKFFPDRIEKHEAVCAGIKIAVKRKPAK
ncbi:uncharacterized protein [Onthophagus taurus]|uniref:uncharacterized protein isoform X2 n=1 Tax=Onthophagus taurus TaxID=166361 RepID=UPI0039BE9134